MLSDGMAKRVLPKEAASLMGEGWVYLDVRSIPEFEAGHPTGAMNIPLLHHQNGMMVPNDAFQPMVEKHVPKDCKVLVGCKMGGRSAQAAAFMEALGYTQVLDVRAGFLGEQDMMGRISCPGWVDEGLPVSKEAEPGRSYADLSDSEA